MNTSPVASITPSDCVFSATLENVKLLATLVRTIHLTSLVTLTVSSLGFKLSAQGSSLLHASAYLQKHAFSTFHFRAPSSPSLSTSTPSSSSTSSSSSNSSLSSFSMNLDMNALLECVQLFMSSTSSSSSSSSSSFSSTNTMGTNGSRSESTAIRSKSTKPLFSSSSSSSSSLSSLTSSTSLHLFCQHPDGPLELILQDQGVLSHCKLKTFTLDEEEDESADPVHSHLTNVNVTPSIRGEVQEQDVQDVLSLSFSSVPEYHHIIVSSDWLLETLTLVTKSTMPSTGSSTLTTLHTSSFSSSTLVNGIMTTPILVRVTEEEWVLETKHELGTIRIASPKHASHVERFHLYHPSVFVYPQLSKCLPGLAVSMKTSLRTNSRGVLNIQCMLSPSSSFSSSSSSSSRSPFSSCFIDYVLAPLEVDTSTL